MRRPALLTPLLAAPALSQQAIFAINDITLSGPGCEPDTFQMDISGMGGFIFNAFNVTLGEDEQTSSLSCVASIEFVDVAEGIRVVAQEATVSGRAGLDVGVVAMVKAGTYYGGDEESEQSDEQVLIGSAVCIDFPNPFNANPVFKEHYSVCGRGDTTVVLNLAVEVTLTREEGEGLGAVDVEFAGLRLDGVPCADAEVPVEEAEPAPETPGGEGEGDDECAGEEDGGNDAGADPEAPIEEEEGDECEQSEEE